MAYLNALSRQRLLLPGAFRLFLSMLVFISHISRLAVGAYAVDVFFILSGFWIHRMWVGRYARTRSPYVTYMVSRIWRLLPVFLLAGLVSVLTEWMIGYDRTEALFAQHPLLFPLSQLTILGYATLSNPPVVPAWSLDIEMQFYIVAPFLITGLAVIGWLPMFLVVAICSIIAALSVSYHILPEFLIFFLVGMVAERYGLRPRKSIAVGAAGLALVFVMLIIVSPLRGAVLIGAAPGPLSILNGYISLVLALISAPFALHTTEYRSDGTDVCCADMSYIVYLLHWPAVGWLTLVGGGALHRLPFAGMAIVMVVAICWVVWRYYDQPVNQMRSRWVARRVHSSVSGGMLEPSGP